MTFSYFKMLNLWVHIMYSVVHYYGSGKCEWHRTYETGSERTWRKDASNIAVLSVCAEELAFTGVWNCIPRCSNPSGAPFIAALEAKKSGWENTFFSLGLRLPSPSPSPSEGVVAALRARWIVGSKSALAAISGEEQGDIRTGRVAGGDSEVWCFSRTLSTSIAMLQLSSFFLILYSVCKEDDSAPSFTSASFVLFRSSCIGLCSIVLNSLLRFPSLATTNEMGALPYWSTYHM